MRGFWANLRGTTFKGCGVDRSQKFADGRVRNDEEPEKIYTPRIRV